MQLNDNAISLKTQCKHLFIWCCCTFTHEPLQKVKGHSLYAL